MVKEVGVPCPEDNFQWLDLDKPDEGPHFDLLESCQPAIDSWQAPEVSWHGDATSAPLPYLTQFLVNGLVLVDQDASVQQAWHQLLTPYGEFLPLRLSDHSIEVFHCTNVLDAFDPSLGEPLYRQSGEVAIYRQTSLHADLVPPLAAFRLDHPAPTGPYYTLELVRQIRAGFDTAGMLFKSVWNSTEGPTTWRDM